MKNKLEVKNIQKIIHLENEYDLERALILDRKLRLMVVEDASLKPIRQKLRSLIKEYESKNWSNSKTITDVQVIESDKAESIAEYERLFYQQRKEAIQSKLKACNMTQQDLGLLLGHGKTYTSELINGISPFTLRDLTIIHRLLNIDLKKLVPTFIQNEDRLKIRASLNTLHKSNLKLKKDDLMLA